MANRASADICAQFGFAVKERQEALGLTQGQFAERAGIHRTDLSDIERGPCNVRSYEASDPEASDGCSIEACAVGPVPSHQWSSPVRGRPRWARSRDVSHWRRASCVPETRRRAYRGIYRDMLHNAIETPLRPTPSLGDATRPEPL